MIANILCMLAKWNIDLFKQPLGDSVEGQACNRLGHCRPHTNSDLVLVLHLALVPIASFDLDQVWDPDALALEIEGITYDESTEGSPSTYMPSYTHGQQRHTRPTVPE